MVGGLQRCGTRAVILCALALAGAAGSAAAQNHLPDNTVEGFGAQRLENEYKLSVPEAIIGRVLEHLRTRYGAGIELPEVGGRRFTAVFADEIFVDVYYDVPGRPLLAGGNGIRHRSRFIPGDTANRKDGRELVQVKRNLPGETLSRSEVKFDVRRYPDIRSREDSHPLLGIVKRDQRSLFQQHVRDLGIDPWMLSPVLTLEQRRQRMYLSDEAGPFATLTLDGTRSRRWWLRAEFTELELELNEIRYTSADAAQRAAMEAVTAAVKADLQQAFPQIVQDQTPKYNKAYAALERSFPGGRLIMRASFTPAQVISVLGLAALLLYALVALIRERRARRRAPVRPPLPEPRPMRSRAEPAAATSGAGGATDAAATRPRQA